MTKEYADYLEKEFDIEFESLDAICRLEKKVKLVFHPLEVIVKNIDFAVQVSFIKPLDL
jgi:hypothetical protein